MERCKSAVTALALLCLLSGCAGTNCFQATQLPFLGGSNSDTCGEEGCGESACCPDGCNAIPLLSGCDSCGDGCADQACVPADGACCGESCGAGCGEGCGKSRRKNRKVSGLDGGFERGKKNMLVDGAGWVMGIPSKLMLWNTKVDNHSVSPEVETQLRRYMTAHGLTDVKVRVNQYDPMGEWKRLRANKAIHPGWKYTVGAYATVTETLVPGRLFGADGYNPFTNTINLYSDRASIALREAARARAASGSQYRGVYSASMYIPASPIWLDYTATRDVVRWAQQTRQRKLEREAYLVLFPAYGDRVARSITGFVDVGQGQAIRGTFALLGHAVGRTKALGVSEGPVEIVKTLNGIVRKPNGNAPQNVVESDETQWGLNEVVRYSSDADTTRVTNAK